MSWRLNPDEVSFGGSHGTSGTPGGKTGPRIKSCNETLLHRPTGISVPLVIKPILQTKTQWKETLKQEKEKAFKLLEIKVAKHLKISGR